jgi:DNA-binding FadR family transcriptional regulator
MFASGWKSSASANGTCSRCASVAPIVVLPEPVTPMTVTSGAGGGGLGIVASLVTTPAPGLHADLLEKLGRRIAEGELADGTVLRAEELAAQFDVSRTVVREAVRVLESMGMVTSRRRVGVTVEPRTRWNVFDPLIIRWRLAGGDREAQLQSLSELRTGVEPAAARLAAERATPEQCGATTGAVMDMAVHGRSGDLRAYLAADIVFHRTLLTASGNEMLAALADVVAEELTGLPASR